MKAMHAGFIGANQLDGDILIQVTQESVHPWSIQNYFLRLTEIELCTASSWVLHYTSHIIQ